MYMYLVIDLQNAEVVYETECEEEAEQERDRLIKERSWSEEGRFMVVSYNPQEETE